MSKRLFEEQMEEEYIQDLLYLQEAEYDREREMLNIYTPHVQKRIFSRKIKFKNRRNHHRFAKKNKLPF